MTKLPAGVTPEMFASALKEFAAAIGDKHVYSSEDDVGLYRDAYTPAWGEDYELTASAAVAPSSAEEVSAIVKIANKYMLPLYAVSTGRNLGYGGSAPTLTGSVVVDLKRMDKIHEIDDKRNFCVVEPGVAYFDLYAEIQAQGKKVLVDCPDPGWGSLIGNALDRGVGYMMPMYRDHWNAHCGLEAVLPNGEIVRTGMFAMDKAETYGENKYGFGPMIDGLFSQGNFGIVTRMAFWMMPEPKHFLAGRIKIMKHADMIPLIDHLNYIEDQGLCGQIQWGTPLVLNPNKIDPELAKIHAQPGNGSVEDFEAYAAERNLPFFWADIRFYGTKKTCEAQWEMTQEECADIPGVQFELISDLAFPMDEEKLKSVTSHVTVGVPEMSIFSIGARSDLLPTPRDGHLWFAPLVPRDGKSIAKAQKVFAEAFKELGLPSSVGPFTAPRTWIYRSYVLVLSLGVSRSDPEANKRSIAAFRRLVEVAAEHGWAEYRSAPLFQDQVSDTYNFNNNMLKRVQEQLKDCIDPNGIISPGRGGVWPARFRKEK